MSAIGSKSPFIVFATRTAHATGHPLAFLLAVAVVVGWAVLGPVFGYSDTWQLVINTGTTIITFLMVFLIQNTQNRDSQAMQVKLDELIRVTEGAHNALLNLEDLEEGDLGKIRARYIRLAEMARKTIKEDEFDLCDADEAEVEGQQLGNNGAVPSPLDR